MAQKAETCFSCGAALDESRRRPRRRLPWPDLILFGVIAALLAIWWFGWLAGPSANQPSLLAQRASATARQEAASTAVETPTATPPPPAPTFTATATPPPTPTLAPTPVRHKVEAGDTLELIAGRYGSTIKDIAEANGLGADGFIRVGQELIVPVSGPSGGAGPTATPAGGTLVYRVQPGDTIESIAMRFGSQIDWIVQANRLANPDRLAVGQALLVPLTPRTPTPSATATPAPIATFTPKTCFSAPALLAPADGGSVTGGGEVLLRWASAGLLAADQWYVVTLKVTATDMAVAPYWTKGTTWRLSSDFRPQGQAAEFTWQVQVVAGVPGKTVQPLSPPSPPRRFTWQ